jgi:hypothetical protein
MNADSIQHKDAKRQSLDMDSANYCRLKCAEGTTEISENFGNERVIRAASALGADTSALHEAGKLRIAGGTIGSVGVPIRKTVFFGSEK